MLPCAMARQRRGARGGNALTSLLRSTLEQASVVKDALTHTARTRLDDARAHRRRQDLLAELGEIVVDLVARGEIDVTELPEAAELLRELETIDAPDASARPARPAIPSSRHRFDAREESADDGTVSRGWSPPPRPEARVWRPGAAPAPTPPAAGPASAAARPPAPAPARGIVFDADPNDDDDLADYMHPDDLPPKP